MANQNLSQFGEKLFVADADHTFIWDTAASISKRVSRNSWLNSGTLTSDAPVTISQTWGTTGTYTAAKVNVTETATANPASLLLDLQLGGVTQVNSTKAGSLFARIFVSGNSQTSRAIEVAASGIAMGSLGVLAFAPASSYASNSDLFNVADTFLRRDGAANTLALRNGANGQTFSVYGTYPNATAWERFTITAPTSGNVLLGTYKGTGGIARGLEFQTDGVTRMTLGTNGSATFAALVEITGSSGLKLPATGYGIYWTASTTFNNRSNGVLTISNFAENDFGRLQFGGTTDAFPAIARDGAGLKFTGAAAGATAWIKVPPVAVSALPLAATAGAGARAFVNDALAPTFGSAVTGGGAVLVPVYSDGSAWNVG